MPDKRLSNKKFLLLLLIPLIIIGMALLVSPRQEKKPSSLTRKLTPTIFHAGITQVPTRTPPIRYSERAINSMVDKWKNPAPLSKQDVAVRAKLINSLGGKSGYLYKTPAFRIQYIKSADQFMVEIKNIDIGKAKKDATAWFIAEGVSESGLCNLPVIFFLNSDLVKQLSKLRITFNPLPENCY